MCHLSPVARAAVIPSHGAGSVDTLIVSEDCEAVERRDWVWALSSQPGPGVRPHLHFTQHQVLVLCSLVPNINKVSVVTLPVIAVKHHTRLRKLTLPLRARFIESVISLKQLYHEDGEVLETLGLDGDGDRLDQLRTEKLNLPPSFL